MFFMIRKGRRWTAIGLLAILGLLATACQGEEIVVTATTVPETPTTTAAPSPTPSPTPILEPTPTSTPAGTPTPAPTLTPTSVPTVTPGVLSGPEGYSVTLPEGWALEDKGKEAIFRVSGPGDIVIQVLLVNVPQGMSLEEYMGVLKVNRYEPLSNFQLVSESDVILASGTQGRQLMFTAAPDSGENTYQTVLVRRVEEVFVIEAIGQTAAFEEHQETVDEIVSSFVAE